MGLKPGRSIRLVNYDFPHPRTSERGGILTLTSYSGIYYADYTVNPSGLSVLGIKLDDHEWIEDDRQENPARLRRVERYFGNTRAVVCGSVITDWVHPDYASSIVPGDTAYPGPSGTIINTSDYCSNKIGIFLSKVNSEFYGLNHHESYTVLMEGAGLEYTWMEPYTHIVQHINQSKTFVPIGGWVKLRIDL